MRQLVRDHRPQLVLAAPFDEGQDVRFRHVVFVQLRDAQETDLPLLVPAFLISEISSGFEAGFLLYIAFLVVDLVVANVLSAMGMMMLSPSTVSIPLKLFVFVSVSGISKLIHGLILGYVK